MKNCTSCGKLLEKPEDYFKGDETRDYCLECSSANGEMMLYEEKLLQMVEKLVKSQGLDKQAARTVASNILLKMPAWKEKSDEGKPVNSIRWKIVLSSALVFVVAISSFYFGINRNYYNYFGTQLKIVKMGEDLQGKGIDEYTILHDSSTLVNSNGLSPVVDGNTYNSRNYVVELSCIGDQVKPNVSPKIPSFTFLNWEGENALLYNLSHSEKTTNPYSFKGWQCYTYNMTTEGMSDNTSGVGYKLDSEGFEGVIRSGADSFDWWERRDGKIIVKSRGYKGGGTWKLLEKPDISQKDKNIRKPKLLACEKYIAVQFFDKIEEENKNPNVYYDFPTEKSQIKVYADGKYNIPFALLEHKIYDMVALTDNFFIFTISEPVNGNGSNGYTSLNYIRIFNHNKTIAMPISILTYNDRYVVGYSNLKRNSYNNLRIFDTSTNEIKEFFTEEDLASIASENKSYYNNKNGKEETAEISRSIIVENVVISKDTGINSNAIIAVELFANNIVYKKIDELNKPANYVFPKEYVWNNISLITSAVTSKFIGFQTGISGYETNDPLRASRTEDYFDISDWFFGYGINLHIIDKNKNVSLDNGECHSLSMNNEIAVWVKNYGFASDSRRELCFAYLKMIE